MGNKCAFDVEWSSKPRSKNFTVYLFYVTYIDILQQWNKLQAIHWAK